MQISFCVQMQFSWNVAVSANRQRPTLCLQSGHMVVFYSILLRLVMYSLRDISNWISVFFESKFYAQQICSIDAKHTAAKAWLLMSSSFTKNGWRHRKLRMWYITSETLTTSFSTLHGCKTQSTCRDFGYPFSHQTWTSLSLRVPQRRYGHVIPRVELPAWHLS